MRKVGGYNLLGDYNGKDPKRAIGKDPIFTDWFNYIIYLLSYTDGRMRAQKTRVLGSNLGEARREVSICTCWDGWDRHTRLGLQEPSELCA